MCNVAVTGLHAGDTPTAGIPIVRSLKEHTDWKGRIVGLTYDSFDPGILNNQFLDAGYLLSYPRSGKKAFLERIKYIHEKEMLHAIIPNADAELPSFIMIQEELSKIGIKVFLPTEEQLKRRSKINLSRLSSELKLKPLKTKIISDLNFINLKGLIFPLLVKGDLYEAYIAYSYGEMLHWAGRIIKKWGYPVLLQEYIEGEEYNAAALGDGTGKTLSVVCMKKLIVTEKGKGWAGISIKHPELMELVTNIVRTLNWRGALEVEVIYSKKHNQFYLIDLNPRFPAWIYLATASGINLPFMYLQLVLGNTVRENFNYKPGVVFTNYVTSVITDFSVIDTLLSNGEIRHEKSI